MATRFEQAVGKAQIVSARDGMGPVVLRSTAVRLLQREHAAVVRKVKGMERGIRVRQGAGFERTDGYLMACADLLAWLNERGR